VQEHGSNSLWRTISKPKPPAVTSTSQITTVREEKKRARALSYYILLCILVYTRPHQTLSHTACIYITTYCYTRSSSHSHPKYRLTASAPSAPPLPQPLLRAHTLLYTRPHTTTHYLPVSCTYAYTYIHAYIHAYMHAYIHTYIIYTYIH
jgi:hypothetical protein